MLRKAALAALVLACSVHAQASTDGLLTWLQTLEPFQGSNIESGEGWSAGAASLTSVDGRYTVSVLDAGNRVRLTIAPPYGNDDMQLIKRLSKYITCGNAMYRINPTMARMNAGSDRILEDKHFGIARTFSWQPGSEPRHVVEYTIQHQPADCSEAQRTAPLEANE